MHQALSKYQNGTVDYLCEFLGQKSDAPMTRKWFYVFVFQSHYEICPKYPLTCASCGKENIPRDLVSGLCAVHL